MKHADGRTGRLSAERVSVVTGMRFSAPPEVAWNGLMFYEQIGRRPPLYLRLLLPTPVRTEGGKSAVGDEARCVYRNGHLLKRVTRIAPCRHLRFEVVEQELHIAGAIRLRSGSYTLSELPDRSTRVELETRYVSPRRPRWLWKPLETAVCHAFHRYTLGAMRRALEPRPSEVGPGAMTSGSMRPGVEGEQSRTEPSPAPRMSMAVCLQDPMNR